MLSTLRCSHGTTVAGLWHPNFGGVLGADGKTTSNGRLCDLEDIKIEEFGVDGGGLNLYGASSGIVETCNQVAVKVGELLTKAKEDKVGDKVSYLRQELSELGGYWGYVFRGKEKRGNAYVPFLFAVQSEDSSIGASYYCDGSRGQHALHILDLIPSVAQLTLDEAVVWMERALVYAAIMDHSSGGRSTITRKLKLDRIQMINTQFYFYFHFHHS